MAEIVNAVASSDTDLDMGTVVVGHVLVVAQFATFTPSASSKASGTATISLITSVTGTYGRVDLWEITGSGTLVMTGQDYNYIGVEVSGVNPDDLLEDSDVAEVSGGTAVDTGPLVLAANCLVLLFTGRWGGGSGFTEDGGLTSLGVWVNAAVGSYNLDAADGMAPGGDWTVSTDYTAIAVALNLAAPSALLPILMQHGLTT